MDIKAELKSKAEGIVEKIKSDKDIAAKFQKDPIATVEGLLGVDLPNDQVQGIVDFVKTKLNLDSLGSKLGGLKGSGALYVREGLQLQPLIYGGNQESGLRSGTEAMPQIAAFAAAAGERIFSPSASLPCYPKRKGKAWWWKRGKRLPDVLQSIPVCN